MTDNAQWHTAPTASTPHLLETFAPIFAEIQKGSVSREHERTLPHEQVQWLKDAGFGTLRIPEHLGGFGASLQQMLDLLRLLGSADANIAHIWRNHLAFVEDRLSAPRSPNSELWIKRFVDGDFVGGGWTEASNTALADIKTLIEPAGDGWTITGNKFYATGSLYADWLDVLGAGADGPLTALVRVDQPAVTLIDDWTGFGQRMTGSGSARYDRAHVSSEDIIPISDRFAYMSDFYQITMLAVVAGIVDATLRDGITALKARGRNYPNGLDPVPASDPQLLQVLGRLSALEFGARSALALAAAALDAVADVHEPGELLDELVIASNVATTQAQVVIVDHAMEATTLVFDALGSSGVSEGTRLDRHWRNARTLASHNPRVYKERMLGNWFVNQVSALQTIDGGGGGGQGV